jgi:hypothetical protein
MIFNHSILIQIESQVTRYVTYQTSRLVLQSAPSHLIQTYIINTYKYHTHHSPLTTHHTPVCCFNSRVLGAPAALSPSPNIHPHSPLFHTCNLPLTTHRTPVCCFNSRVLGAHAALSPSPNIHPHSPLFHTHHSPLTTHRSPHALL